jgi:SDR family mycofactocin-dependent oxidoreductase
MEKVEGTTTGSSPLGGRKALVTGAARGQGRSHALRLAADGADIMLLDIGRGLSSVTYEPATEQDLLATASEIEGLGRQAVVGLVDIRDYSALSAFVEKGVAELGELDIVVANAGINSMARTWELTEQQWGEVIYVNLTGTWHTVKATVPILIAQGRGGSIILVNSSSGARPRPFLAHYSASKAGGLAMMRSLAAEVGEYNIRVNAVLPTAVDTPMAVAPEFPAILEGFPNLSYAFSDTAVLPTTGLLDPREISAAVAWLASDESRFITGSTLAVDAGAIIK